MNLYAAGFSIAIAVLVLLHAASAPADEPAAPLKAGDTFTLGGQHAKVTGLDFLPLVESDYTRRFKFDSYDNPKLKELRQRNKLDEVVSAGKTEFDRQVLLLDWVNNRFKKFGTPSAKPRGAAEILRDIDEGHTFFCAHYADVLVSAAASLGWVDRSLALRRPANVGSGSSEHSSTEIWSNQFRKWEMFDPTFAMFVEKDGQPLNAYELRQEWFYHDGRNLTFLLGKDRQRYRKADLPVFRKRFAGFGDLSLDPSALNVYASSAMSPIPT
jgi:transglutaminase-like putative cysteine protease